MMRLSNLPMDIHLVSGTVGIQIQESDSNLGHLTMLLHCLLYQKVKTECFLILLRIFN